MRYNYLDFARGILMSIGIIIHTSYIFSTYPWRISTGENIAFFTYLIDLIHSFRMESFYVVSGFFSMMIIEKYSLNIFLKTRVLRLGVPMLFCGLTFNVLMHLMSNGNYLHVSAAFDTSYWLGGGWLSHLWFLANLIGYCVLVYLALIVFKRYVIRLKYVKINYFVFLLSVFVFFILVRRIGWRIPNSPWGDKWVLIDTGKFVFYFTYFIVGIVIYQNKIVRFKYIQLYQYNMILYLLSLLFMFVFKGDINVYLIEIVNILNTISLTGLILTVFYKFFNKPSYSMRVISDASYTIYLLHQPIIVALGLLIIKLPIHYSLKFILISFPAWYLPYLFHIKIVKRFPVLGFLFNGKPVKK